MPLSDHSNSAPVKPAKFKRPPQDVDSAIDRIGKGHFDPPTKVRQLADYAVKVADSITELYEDERTARGGMAWNDYAKLLARRIRAQRREIKRLHAKVRELRADIHERDERIASLASDETQQEDT